MLLMLEFNNFEEVFERFLKLFFREFQQSELIQNILIAGHLPNFIIVSDGP